MRRKVQCGSISRAVNTALPLAVVFLLAVVAAPRAQAQTYSVLYTFTGGAVGSHPDAGLIQDAAGNLYGTTDEAGSFKVGTVFKLSKGDEQTVLYSFLGPPDGATPDAVLLRDGAGNLYGTTYRGGSHHCGTVFKLDTTGKETVLYDFCSVTKAEDGRSPSAGLIRDTAGSFYGNAVSGGTYGHGVVYKLDRTGHETVLYSFTGGADGAVPAGSLVRDEAGNLYGTTGASGAHGYGVVFKLDTTGHETVLYSFTGGKDGAEPSAGLIRDAEGNLYGTTDNGGTYNQGVVFKLDKTNKETVLHAFTGGDGSSPGELVRDAAGNLYGPTFGGGTYGYGVVFELNPTTRKETVLYSFTGGADGPYSESRLVRDADGNLYGVAKYGGDLNCFPAHWLRSGVQNHPLNKDDGKMDFAVSAAYEPTMAL